MGIIVLVCIPYKIEIYIYDQKFLFYYSLGLCVTDVTRDKSCPTDSLVDSCIGESLNASKCSCRISFLFFNASSRSCERKVTSLIIILFITLAYILHSY